MTALWKSREWYRIQDRKRCMVSSPLIFRARCITGCIGNENVPDQPFSPHLHPDCTTSQKRVLFRMHLQDTALVRVRKARDKPDTCPAPLMNRGVWPSRTVSRRLRGVFTRITGFSG
jgi:hypothetical protein